MPDNDNYVNLPLSNDCNIDSEQLVEENDHEIVRRSEREKNPQSRLGEWVYISNDLQQPKLWRKLFLLRSLHAGKRPCNKK